MTPQDRQYYNDLFYLMGLLDEQRDLLERCERHMSRLVERYAQINAGDRKLHKALKEYLGK